MELKLQEIRKQAGYKSAASFAKVLGVSTSTYTHWEQGDNDIPLKQAYKCAQILKCSLDELVGAAERKPTPIQDRYDALGVSERRTIKEFLDFMDYKKEQERRESARRLHNSKVNECKRLLLGFRALGGTKLFNVAMDERTAFEKYLNFELNKKRNKEVDQLRKYIEMKIKAEKELNAEEDYIRCALSDDEDDGSSLTLNDVYRYTFAIDEAETEMKKQNEYEITSLMEAYDEITESSEYEVSESWGDA